MSSRELSKEPNAPIHTLSGVQQEGLVTVFFAGEMCRHHSCFIAVDSPDVKSSTAHVLHRRGLIILRCEKSTDKSIHRAQYKYIVRLTERGHWYVNTILKAREEGRAKFVLAVEQIGADA